MDKTRYTPRLSLMPLSEQELKWVLDSRPAIEEHRRIKDEHGSSWVFRK